MKRGDIPDADVVRACDDFHSGRSASAPWVLLMERTGAVEKVVYAAMQRAHDRGLIEYGVSLRTAWVARAGRALLDPRGAA